MKTLELSVGAPALQSTFLPSPLQAEAAQRQPGAGTAGEAADTKLTDFLYMTA